MTHLQSRFFNRCPSSTTIYFHRKPDKNCLSFIQISYVVTTTGKVALVLDPALNALPLCPALPFPNLPTPAAVGGCRRVARISARSSLDPWYMITYYQLGRLIKVIELTGMVGANFSNSITQLLSTDNGQTIRKGPHVPFDLR
jgi:hypothetical protein